MTPREHLEMVRERWRAIVSGLLLGLAVAGGAIYLVPREYSASVTVLVAAQAQGGTTTETDEISSQRLATYSELLGSRRVAGNVIADLGLRTTPDGLAERIGVTTAPDSVLLTATVSDGDPDQAIRIANSLADQFIRNIAEIEQPSDPARPPAVVAKTFEQAQPPAEQVAPRPLLYLVVGAVLGLLVGLATAILRNGLDSTLRRRSQLEDVLRAPVLGVIGRDPKVASSPLVIYGAPNAPLAEAFRQLRTNVQFTDVDKAHKVVLVTSPSWQEGRTTTVCNLALALAEAGTSVLIIDADLRRSNVARSLRLDKQVGLADVLADRVPIEHSVQALGPSLDVLPSGPLPPNPSELLGSTRMVKLIAAARLMYEVVLIDTAALLPVTDAAVLAPRVDGVLVLARHGHTDVPSLQAAKDALDAVSGRILGSVMTMVPGTGRRSRVRRRRDTRAPKPFGPVRSGGSARGTGSAVPGPTPPGPTPPGPTPPGPTPPGPTTHDPVVPGPTVPSPRPQPAPRPSSESPPRKPSDSGGQVLDRGPAAGKEGAEQLRP